MNNSNKLNHESSIPLHAQLLSCVRLFATLWAVACQGSLSMEFSRQEQWSGLPFPSPGDLPDPGIKPASPALVGGFFTYPGAEPHGKPLHHITIEQKPVTTWAPIHNSVAGDSMNLWSFLRYHKRNVDEMVRMSLNIEPRVYLRETLCWPWYP